MHRSHEHIFNACIAHVHRQGSKGEGRVGHKLTYSIGYEEHSPNTKTNRNQAGNMRRFWHCEIITFSCQEKYLHHCTNKKLTNYKGNNLQKSFA